jgi:hypothetical protein
MLHELSLGRGGWGGLGSKLGYRVPSATPDKVTFELIVCALSTVNLQSRLGCHLSSILSYIIHNPSLAPIYTSYNKRSITQREFTTMWILPTLTLSLLALPEALAWGAAGTSPLTPLATAPTNDQGTR